VFGHGSVSILPVIPLVGSDAMIVIYVNLNIVGVVNNGCLLSDVFERNTVIMSIFA
jgi:hypothetical protein